MSATCIAVCWDEQTTPPALHAALDALGEHYPIHRGARRGAVTLEFVAGAAPGCVNVTRSGATVRIEYDQLCHARRGVGSVLSGLAAPGKTRRERISFDTFGIMLDCSRNGVMTVEHFKGWLRQLSLLGYNMAMLYTEDTYELPGYEYFGYLRGRYTADELREIDRYAASLGIEMIACVQTLGHMEQILRWEPFGAARDTSSVLMVDAPETYELIERIIAHWANVFGSRRIHVGMDEAHDLGRGRFMDRNGYERMFDLFNRHLGKVVQICERHGLEPMIWSDMYFRMGSKTQAYYDEDCDVPTDVVAAIPPQAQLVYWDYYHDSEGFYRRMIDRHRRMGHEPVMASGVWTWQSLWYDKYRTESFARPCLLACRDAKVKDFFFTLWGDDGACCEFDSALAGLAWGAEIAYAGQHAADRDVARRFAALCGADYGAVLAAADVSKPAPDLVWDDPILAILWKDEPLVDAQVWPKAARRYEKLLARLAKFRKQTGAVDFAHAATLAELLLEKIHLRTALERAYAKRNAAGLRAVARRVPTVCRKIDALLASFRRQWYNRNKPQGFEVIQIRLAGLRQRYMELAQRIGELLAGKTESIPELDESPAKQGLHWRYKNVASGSVNL